MRDVSAYIGVFLLILSVGILVPHSSEAQPASAVQLAQQLRSTPVCDHNSIYNQIHRDTSVLSHPALRKELLRLAKEVWFKKYVKGGRFDLNEGLECEMPEGAIPYSNYLKIVYQMRGKDALRIWIHVMPSARIGPPSPEAVRYAKKKGVFFTKLFLKKVQYRTNQQGREKASKKSNKSHPEAKDSNYNNRRVYSGTTTPFSEIMYDIVRYNWEKYPTGLKKKLKRFLNQVLKAKRTDITFLKTFAIATLLDRDVTEQKIRKTLNHPDQLRASGDLIVQNLFSQTVPKLRAEYPQWPVNNEKSPKNPNKVTVCHKPQRSELDQPVTLQVSKQSLKAHLDHGDYKGACKK